MNNADHNIYLREKVKKGDKINTIMSIHNVDLWKKMYAWITYLRPHLMYAAHIYCGTTIAEKKRNKQEICLRDYIKIFN